MLYKWIRIVMTLIRSIITTTSSPHPYIIILSSLVDGSDIDDKIISIMFNHINI